MSTIQETKSEAQTLLDALNATAGNGHVYEFVHDFKVDGRSKEGKTFKKLEGYWDVKVHPVKGAWSTYFLVIWNEVKEEYADTLADFDVEKAATAKLVRASLVDEDGENLWFCLTTDNEQGFAWLVEDDRESLNTRRRIEDLTSGDLIRDIQYKILGHQDDIARADKHAANIALMIETQPLTNYSEYAVNEARKFIEKYHEKVKSKLISTMSLREIHEAGVDQVVAEIAAFIIDQVGKAYGSSSVRRTIRTNKDSYSRVQIDDVLFYLTFSWRNQQWSEYEPFMDDAMKKLQSLISY